MNFDELMEDRAAEYRLRRITWRQQVKDRAYQECMRLLHLFIDRPKLYNYHQLQRALARYESK